MAQLVKGQNLENSAEDNLKENIISLPKEKKYYVVTDDDGNIKGFSSQEQKFGKGLVCHVSTGFTLARSAKNDGRTIKCSVGFIV